MYQRGRLVADTGQAWVYEGRDASTGERVAIKVLDASTTSRNADRDFARFRRELRVQQELSDLAVMPIYSIDMDAAPPHYVMPWADRTLRDYIGDSSSAAEHEALDVFSEVVSAMAQVHERGVVHRDLKPENILMLTDRWVIADFGMCRELDSMSATITSKAIGLGTIEYCAPEQMYDAHAADFRSDVYSLGKMLYHLLTREMPFPTLRLDLLPPRFQYVVAKATKDDPARRHTTAAALSADLELLLREATDLHAPADVAKTEHDAFLNGDHEALDRLARVLVEHPDDEVLYQSVVPYLSDQAIVALLSTAPEDFRQVLLTFDEHVSGRLPFEYTDVVARFLQRVFDNEVYPEVRERILRRVLTMGHEHNRYAVRDIFCQLTKACIGGPETLMVVQVLRDDPDAAAFMAERLRLESLPQVVLRALPATA